jgi:hypothetical protein
MRFRKPSPATLIALLALFVALGGSSYAALQVPRGSVGTKQLKNNAVTSPKVRNNSLLLRDFRASQRARLRGERGPQGVPGPAGAAGAAGPAGPAGPAGAPGSAIAFARVDANGIVDPAVSSGIAVLSTGSGTYCLDRTGGAVRNFVTTVDDVALPNGNTVVATGTARSAAIVSAGCPAGTDVLVVTRQNGNFTSFAFYIAIVA